MVKFGKVILAILMSSSLGAILSPEVMTASDRVSVTGVESVYMGPTEVLPDPEISLTYGGDFVIDEKPAVLAAAPEVVKPVEIVEKPTVVFKTAEVVKPADEIVIFGNRISLKRTDALTENAGDKKQAWQFGEKFIYGHNYAHVLGVIGDAYDAGRLVGAAFTVTMGGATTTYTVAEAAVYTYNQASAKMNKFMNATGHALSIMTCYGENSRIVLFADA